MALLQLQGLASPKKKLALKRQISYDPYDIIFLQEALGTSDDIFKTLLGIMLGWHFQAMNATGSSGGLALRINPRTIRVITSWGGLGFLSMDLFSTVLDK